MTFALLLLTSLVSFSPAHAEDKHENGPCAADRKKFCADVKPGGGAIIKCMKEHEAQLSTECKAMGEKMKGKMKEGREACKGDVEKLCKGVQPGGGAIIKCLHEHQAELSEQCRNTIPQRQH